MLTHGGEMHSVSWSPDGRWIACVLGNRRAQHPSFLFANRGPARLAVLPANGGQAVPITDDRWYNSSPAWSPDGRSLLFVSNRGGGVDLYQLRLSERGRPEGEPARLTNGLRALSVGVAPAGRHVVYTDFRETSNVYTLPVPVGGPISVREAEPLTRGNQVIETVDVSWDGSWLAYDSDQSGNPDIWRMRLPNGEPERLTTDEAEEYRPTWSPDGRTLAFHAFPGSRRHLYTMSGDGRDRRRITEGSNDERAPQW